MNEISMFCSFRLMVINVIHILKYWQINAESEIFIIHFIS